MPLGAGAKLGSYEIIAAIGAGGMGQVYRARDTRLGRDVALKVLPEPFASDAERIGRFSREAHLLASFNHPNIAQIYGFEEAQPAHGPFLVMELVEGLTLEGIVSGGPLPIARALEIARQLAQALDAAHEKGIIHRDLKPANIKITDDGVVKVLDFGLAKALEGDRSALSSSPSTMTSPAMTQMGVILGTAAYMSPEQARGRLVDKRGDIWAFGCVLYEMITGRSAFGGETMTDTLGAIVHKDPDWSALPPSLPAPVAQLLRRCLQKDLKTRLRDIGDAHGLLGDQNSSASSAAIDPGTDVRAAVPHARKSLLLMMGSLAAGAVLGLAAGWTVLRVEAPTTSARAVRFSISVPQADRVTAVAVTRSGDAIVIETDRLYVRSVADETFQPIAGTEGARNLFLSPDGKWVGFIAGGKIKKVSLAGGDALNVCNVDSLTPGAAWGADNSILFSPGWISPLHAVSADGGTPKAISTVNVADGELGHWWPDVLPDGKAVLFTIWRAGSGINDARVGLLDLTSGRHRALMPGAGAKFLSSGHLLYFHAGAYHVVRFDPVSQQTSGDSRKVFEDAQPLDPNGTREKPIATSADGRTVAYVAGGLWEERQLAWVTRAGVIDALPFPPHRFGDATLSPDGRYIAVSRLEHGKFSVWLYDLVRKTQDRLGTEGSTRGPVWKRDSKGIAYYSLTAGHFDVTLRQLDEAAARPLIVEPQDQLPTAWTRDGRTLAVHEYFSDGTNLVTLADPADPAKRRRIGLSGSDMENVALSPDDRWIAVELAGSGRPEILVQRFPDGGPRFRVSPEGGAQPVWSPSGTRLYYRRGNDLFSVSYRDDTGRFAVEAEQRVLTLAKFDLVGVGPDERFLIARYTGDAIPRVRVAANWSPDAR